MAQRAEQEQKDREAAQLAIQKKIAKEKADREAAEAKKKAQAEAQRVYE